MFAAREPSDIDRFFRGLTEYAFHTRLGVVDPPLVDYVALLLVRFLRNETGPLPRTVVPEDVADVAALHLAVQEKAATQAARETYRHIGDYTLFWSGLYPEAVARRQPAVRTERLIDFRAAGRQAYWLASTLEPDDAAEERLLFERLAHEYDLCVEGLTEVRRAWGDAA